MVISDDKSFTLGFIFNIFLIFIDDALKGEQKSLNLISIVKKRKNGSGFKYQRLLLCKENSFYRSILEDERESEEKSLNFHQDLQYC